MIHLGRHDVPLIENNFEAWYLGPVSPDLYHHAKIYGAEPVKNIFNTEISLDKETLESKTLSRIYGVVGNFSGSRLIAITHCDYGAWSKYYKPNHTSIIIPNKDILDEYHERTKRAREHVNQSSESN